MSAPTSTELQQLLEEKSRILRRLQEKSAAAAAAATPHATTNATHTTTTTRSAAHSTKTHNEKREAGFNVYISGANEDRVEAEARRRRDAARKVGVRTKTWAKPVVDAARDHDDSHSHIDDSDHFSSESPPAASYPSVTSSGDSSAAAAAAPPKKRKQWKAAPVALMGADTVVAPPSQSHSYRAEHDHEHDSVDGEMVEEDSTLLALSTQPAVAASSSSVEESLEIEAPSPSYEEEGFDPLSPHRMPVSSTRVRQNRPMVHESIAEDLLQSHHEDDEDDRMLVAVEDDDSSGPIASLPLSPPPLSLRKKDVSLLRESLEALSKARQTTVPSQKHATHHVPHQQHAQLSSTIMDEFMAMGQQQEEQEQALSGSIDSARALVSPTPISATDPLPAPVTSSSPTLPTRSLGSSSSFRTRASRQQDDSGVAPPPAFTNVRTSVSFAEDTKPDRPSTPLNTDSSTLRTSLLLSQSFDKGSVETLLNRFRSLPKQKRAKLLAVLADLERGDATDIPSDLKDSLEFMQKQSQAQAQTADTTERHAERKPAKKTPAAPAESTSVSIAPLIALDAITGVVGADVPAASSSSSVSPDSILSPVPVPSSKLALLKQKKHPSASGVSSASTSVVPSPAVSARGSPSPSPAVTSPTADPTADAQPEDELVVASFAPPVPTLTFRVLGSWGHPSAVGLAHIELFDALGSRLRVPPSCVHFAWTAHHPAPGGLRTDVAKVVTGKNPRAMAVAGSSPDEKSLWLMPLTHDTFVLDSDERRHGFELQLYLPAFFATPTRLDVWNYRRGVDVTRGVRRIEVALNGRVVFEGEVPKAAVDLDKGPTTERPTRIALQAGVNLADDDEEEEIARPAINNEATKPYVMLSGAATATTAATASMPTPSRPLWLQGTPVPAIDLASAATEPTIAPSGLGHSASAASLSANRRRGTLRDQLHTAQPGDTSTGPSLPPASAMVPPLLPAGGAWSGEAAVTNDPFFSVPAPKRPMSGRRALPAAAAAAQSGAATQPAAAPSVLEPLVKRAPSAGRRRPSVSDAATSSSAGASLASAMTQSSSTATLQPASSLPPPPVGVESVSTAVDGAGVSSASSSPRLPVVASASVVDPPQRRPRRSELEESWDSLEHFQHHHQGRLPPPNDEAAAAASETSTNALASGRTAAAAASAAAAADEAATRGVQHIDLDDTASVAVLPSAAVSAATVAALKHAFVGVNAKEDESDDDVDLDLGSPTPSSTTFSLPTLPTGRRLTLTLLSTWGDFFYIGLSGLDLFDASGAPLVFTDRVGAIRASPADVNVLTSGGGGERRDPRVVANLLDGVNHTCDDVHHWLAPFSRGKRHVVEIDLGAATAAVGGTVALSLLRVWNYNKSRIHSARGVRDLEIALDGRTIFRGVVAQAPGNVADAPTSSENILFTTDARILANIAACTQLRGNAGGDANDAALLPSSNDFEPQVAARPPTSGAGGGRSRDAATGSIALLGPATSVHTSVDMSVARPKTSAVPSLAPDARDDHEVDSDQSGAAAPATAAPADEPDQVVGGECPLAREVCLYLVSTHGDPYFVGLTGLELLDDRLRPIPLSLSNLSAHPQDINSVPGHSGDNRTLDKLVNGTNCTTDDNSMWLAPNIIGQEDHSTSKTRHPYGEQWLKVRLESPRRIAAMRVWNYNKSEEDTYRGMRYVRVTIDGTLVSPHSGFLLRKAVGNAEFDFGQVVHLRNAKVDTIPPAIRKNVDFTMPVLPCGFILKFLFLSSWGDPHYIGLNGLELFDHRANKIDVRMQSLTHQPRSGSHTQGGNYHHVISVNDLHAGSPPVDTRTVDKLFDGINDTFDDSHMFLGPLLPSLAPGGQPRNVLYIYFDAPVAIAAIKVWNYSKTPSRGVQAMQVLMDDVIIYDGVLRAAPSAGSRAARGGFAQSLLFCAHPDLLEREAANVHRDLAEQDVLLVDERRFMNQPSAQAAPVIPHGKTHAQVAAASAGKSTGAPRPKTMARGL